MVALKDALPFLVMELESALAHIGRGDVVDQLRKARIERWSYDELAGTAYLHLRSPGAAEAPGETVSVYDELGVNLDTDSQGRLTGMEILEGRAIIEQLEKGRASPPSTLPRSP